MPIRPDQRPLYPFEWRQLSQFVRFQRAGGRCEQCGRPHAAKVAHLPGGHWWDEAHLCWRDERGRKARLPTLDAFASAAPTFTGFPSSSPFRLRRVILATAHLDHDPTNNTSLYW